MAVPRLMAHLTSEAVYAEQQDDAAERKSPKAAGKRHQRVGIRRGCEDSQTGQYRGHDKIGSRIRSLGSYGLRDRSCFPSILTTGSLHTATQQSKRQM